MKTIPRGARIPFGLSRQERRQLRWVETPTGRRATVRYAHMLKLPLWWAIRMKRYDPSYDEFRLVPWRPVLLIRSGEPGLLIRWGWEPA